MRATRSSALIAVAVACGLIGCSQTEPVRSMPARIVTCSEQTVDAPDPLHLVERRRSGRILTVRVLDSVGGAVPGARVEVDGRPAFADFDGVTRGRIGRRLSVRALGFWGVDARLRRDTREVVVRLQDQAVESCD